MVDITFQIVQIRLPNLHIVILKIVGITGFVICQPVLAFQSLVGYFLSMVRHTQYLASFLIAVQMLDIIRMNW